jgi:hypothetical protein
VSAYGPLPFARTGALMQRPDTVIAERVPCTVWPTRTQFTRSGLVYDHQAEVPVSYYEQAREPNVLLEIDGTSYVVVEAQCNIFLPHTALLVREARSAGA